MSPASRKATFDGVRTGAEVTVQMTIVVDTTDGDYLISDILKAGIHQSLTNPAFRDHFRRWPGADSDPEPTGGIFHFVGYNENFTNYRAVAGESFATIPTPERLRVGLAHGSEDDDARDAVVFNAYRLRITDGDVVPEGDNVNTIAAAETVRRGEFKYSDGRTIVARLIHGHCHDAVQQRLDQRQRPNPAPIHDGGPRPVSNFFPRSICVSPRCAGQSAPELH
ncbi:MAG: hypothetical protein F4Y80_02890 [Caldilineaceae bacterium SB0665_bin_21]|nr:hypothetical protein [Caldilineaceae bacterium SB0665_bin_21]